MRWFLAPACIIVLALVLANAISISVRERRTELAVMKVLGFRPRQIVLLVLGESVLLGLLSGLASAAGDVRGDRLRLRRIEVPHRLFRYVPDSD